MDWISILISTIFMVLGVFFALWFENLGSPKLIIEKQPTSVSIRTDEQGNKHTIRFLHLIISNKPKKIPLTERKTALSVHGNITFFDPNNAQVGKTMIIRWDGNPEPLQLVNNNGEWKTFIDNRLIRSSYYIDIPPDETESFAIAIRINNEENAFGWTSQSYAHDWRHPDYKLPKGEYLVRIVLICGNCHQSEKFKFTNPIDADEFSFI